MGRHTPRVECIVCGKPVPPTELFCQRCWDADPRLPPKLTSHPADANDEEDVSDAG